MDVDVYKSIPLAPTLNRCPEWYQRAVEHVDNFNDLREMLSGYDARIVNAQDTVFNPIAHYLVFDTADGYARFCLRWM